MLSVRELIRIENSIIVLPTETLNIGKTYDFIP